MSKRGCKNKTDPTLLPGRMVQDGWTEDGRKRMVFQRTQWSNVKCGSSLEHRQADPECADCKWRLS